MFYRKIVPTADGSATIFIPEWNESYHSRHGAIQEAYHVFIKNGLELISGQNEISILEIGFGTGLNAFITLLESNRLKIKINYTGIEKYPVSNEEFSILNYPESLKTFHPDLGFTKKELKGFYGALMSAEWERKVSVTPEFHLTKLQLDFLDYPYPQQQFDLIYFDAFGSRVQPELWTETLFKKLYNSLKTGGVLTTYSAKG